MWVVTVSVVTEWYVWVVSVSGDSVSGDSVSGESVGGDSVSGESGW